MGYCYTQSGALACDRCGNGGGARKRTCPYKVTGDSVRSPDGSRHALPYCYPPALCKSCYAALGGLRGIHGDDCREGAARSQAEADAVEAGLDAGDLRVASAIMDDTPGNVRVTFWGRRPGLDAPQPEVTLVMPDDAYDYHRKPWLSDYAEYNGTTHCKADQDR